MIDDKGHIRTVARQAVRAMVGSDIEVLIDADGVLLGMPWTRDYGLVHVEMIGPRRGKGSTSVKAEAVAWDIGEVVDAARRAAARILVKNPSWRRKSA